MGRVFCGFPIENLGHNVLRLLIVYVLTVFTLFSQPKELMEISIANLQ